MKTFCNDEAKFTMAGLHLPPAYEIGGFRGSTVRFPLFYTSNHTFLVCVSERHFCDINEDVLNRFGDVVIRAKTLYHLLEIKNPSRNL